MSLFFVTIRARPSPLMPFSAAMVSSSVLRPLTTSPKARLPATPVLSASARPSTLSLSMVSATCRPSLRATTTASAPTLRLEPRLFTTLRLPLRVSALRSAPRRTSHPSSMFGWNGDVLTCLVVYSVLDQAAFVKAKINNSGVLALGLYLKILVQTVVVLTLYLRIYSNPPSRRQGFLRSCA